MLKSTHLQLFLIFTLSLIFFSCKKKPEPVVAEVVNSEISNSLFNLSTPNNLTLSIPGLGVDVVIDSMLTNSNFLGEFSNGGESGEVVIDKGEIIQVEGGANPLYVIPYTVNSSHAQPKHYLGIVEYDGATKQFRNIDNKLLGEGVEVEDIEFDGLRQITAKFKSHGPDQDLSESPTVENNLSFIVDRNGFLDATVK